MHKPIYIYIHECVFIEFPCVGGVGVCMCLCEQLSLTCAIGKHEESDQVIDI